MPSITSTNEAIIFTTPDGTNFTTTGPSEKTRLTIKWTSSLWSVRTSTSSPDIAGSRTSTSSTTSSTVSGRGGDGTPPDQGLVSPPVTETQHSSTSAMPTSTGSSTRASSIPPPTGRPGPIGPTHPTRNPSSTVTHRTTKQSSIKSLSSTHRTSKSTQSTRSSSSTTPYTVVHSTFASEVSPSNNTAIRSLIIWLILTLFGLGAMLVIGAVMIAKGCCKCLTGKSESNDDVYNDYHRRVSHRGSADGDVTGRHHRRHRRSRRLTSASSDTTTTSVGGDSNLELHEIPRDHPVILEEDEDIASVTSSESTCSVVITRIPMYIEQTHRREHHGVSRMDSDPPPYAASMTDIPHQGESSTDHNLHSNPHSNMPGNLHSNLHSNLNTVLPTYDSLRDENNSHDLPRYEDIVESGSDDSSRL